MQQEKYSRQIRLFGESTQKKIEDSHIHIISKKEDRITLYIKRLLDQMGAKICNIPDSCTKSPTCIFACDLSKSIEPIDQGTNVFYISTSDLSLSKEHRAADIDSMQPVCIEYINILAGVAVQEYVKELSGAEPLQNWRLDTSIFE